MSSKRQKAVVMAAILAAGGVAWAQTVIDSFRPALNEHGYVYAIAQQSDGGLFIGGDFSSVNMIGRKYIARIHANGMPDMDCAATADGGLVYTLARQADDKVLAGGLFTEMNGVARALIARLMANGELDVEFNPGVSGSVDDVPPTVLKLVVQPDGKILVGGFFTTLADNSRKCIGRLNQDGSIDASFNAQINPDHAVEVAGICAIAVQPDGKILIGGDFRVVCGKIRHHIARLHADGSLDELFDPGANSMVRDIIVQSDGKIILVGAFTEAGGTECSCLARLNSDGTFDASFNVGSGIDAGTPVGCLPQFDGKIVVFGGFTSFNGAPHARCVRLNINGELDPSFDIGVGFNKTVVCMLQQADGKLLAGGLFEECNNSAYPYIVRLYEQSGKIDSAMSFVSKPDNTVYAVAVQRDERILIGGLLTAIGGAEHKGIARVGPDYNNVDAGFTASAVGGSVRAIVVQPDDKILMGGYFTTVNDAPHNYIARLLADGSLDPAFVHSVIAGGGVRGLALQPDGKIIVAGQFATVAGAPYKGIARLNANGVLDASFSSGEGVGEDYVNSVVLQPDGKVLVGGNFTALAGQPRNNAGRLNADGSIDASFNPNINGEVRVIALQPDGKILMGGTFTEVGAQAHNRIVRLNADGTIDAAFGLDNGVNFSVRSIQIQCDGKLVIVGSFTTAGGENRKYIAPLNGNGSLDATFAVSQEANNAVYAAMAQKDGKIICGGEFTDWGATKYLARVKIQSAALQALIVSQMGDEIKWLRSGASPELARCIFEYSADGVAWSELGVGARIAGGWRIGGLNLPRNVNFYVRAKGLYDGGYYNSSGSLIDSVRLVYLVPPLVRITNISGVVTGNYGAVTHALAGTNNINVSGMMRWSNSLGGGAVFPAVTPWSVTVAGLHVGTNVITVFCSNMVGAVASDSVNIVQRRNDYAAADFDGDGLADPAFGAGAQWFDWLSTHSYVRSVAQNYGLAGAFPAAADFDGDGLADPAVYDNRTGKWYIWPSSYQYWPVGPLSYGVIGAAPAPADFDGDGLADFAVFAAGNWYVWLSSDAYRHRFGPCPFGLADGIPVAGDFDGDGLADPAVYHKGIWYVWLSSLVYRGVHAALGDDPESYPLAADFDGDGLYDIALVKGVKWHARISMEGYRLLGAFTFNPYGASSCPD